jgi:hypothetical protein
MSSFSPFLSPQPKLNPLPSRVDACAAAILKTKPRFIFPILEDAEIVQKIAVLLDKIPRIRELLSRMQPNPEALTLYRQVRGIADELA